MVLGSIAPLLGTTRSLPLEKTLFIGTFITGIANSHVPFLLDLDNLYYGPNVPNELNYIRET